MSIKESIRRLFVVKSDARWTGTVIMVENDNRPKKSSTRGQKTLDNAKKLNFKILRSRDYDTGFLFAVHKLNSSCNLLLAAH